MTAGRESLLGFKRHLKAAVIPGEAAYLISPHGVLALRGRPIEALAPLLDGSRTLDALVRDAAPLLPAEQVHALVERLDEAEVLAARPATCHAAQSDLAYWDHAGLDGDRAAAEVAAVRVELLVIGDLDPAPVYDACAAGGLTPALVTAPGPAGAFTVVLCDDYLSPAVAEIDRRQRARGLPWLIAKPCSPAPWIGPIFQPGAGPCLRCLTHRLAGHRHAALRLRAALGDAAQAPESSIAAARAVAAQFVALETAKWLAGVRQQEQQTLYTFDTLTLDGIRHPVHRRPQCPECGDAGLVAARAGEPVLLESRSKAPGAERAADPGSVLERYRRLVDPLTGVIAELVPDEEASEFVHCVSGGRIALPVRPHAEDRLLPWIPSGGKGITATQAQVGALGEAVEHYCAHRQGDELVVRGSYRALRADAIHPDTYQLYDERQYQDRDRWNAVHGDKHWICDPFDEQEIREWTPVWSLTHAGFRLLPTASLYFHQGGEGSSSQLCADSNGRAAGASLEDAILQGFFELVERDAAAVWWYNRTRQPGIELESFADPWLDRVRRRHDANGRALWALDLTTDLGVPVVAALDGASLGFGAHFDLKIALRRAVTELCQQQTRDCELFDHLRPSQEPATTSRTYAYQRADDLREDVERAIALLSGAGLDMLALDQTRPDLGMPVVKVLVPGLRPMRARLAPGRLFDVPVDLGRLPHPTDYPDLNPLPLPV
ncbi:MAG TPA: TOMM precursor leader peptide-binding protein [Actinospica sp.]|nr:TOMM precursor leader peptide-binding protein [Actinospica sp.]